MVKKDGEGSNIASKIDVFTKEQTDEFKNLYQNMFNGRNGIAVFNTANKKSNHIANQKDPYGNSGNGESNIRNFVKESAVTGISDKTFTDEVGSSSTQDNITSTNRDIIVKPMGKSNTDIESLFRSGTRSTLKMQSAMMEQNLKIAKTTFSSLKNIHKSMHDVNTFQRTIQASYYKTSLSYKKDTLEELKKITAILKTGFSIKEESNGRFKLDNKNKGDKENDLLAQLFSGRPGSMVSGLKTAIKNTVVKQASGGAYSDLFDMVQMFLPLIEGMNGKSLLRMGASGIANKQFEKLVGVRQAESIKNWMSDPRSMISNFAKSMMTSNNSLMKDFFSNFIDGEATAGSTKTFNIKEYMKKDPQGRAVFNNMTQRSITHIIPYHLANIEGFMGHLSKALGDKSKPQFRYYNYGENKFESMKDVDKDMANGTGHNFKKVIERVSKEYTNKTYNPIKDLLDEQGKYQSEFLKELSKDPKKVSIIGGDIISFCTILAQQGIDVENLLLMRTPTASELISMGVYSNDLDKKAKMSRATVLVRFITEIKRLKTEDSKWLLDDIFVSVAESLRSAYEKDMNEISNIAENSIGSLAYIANEKNSDFNNRFSSNRKKFGFNEDKSGSFDLKTWQSHFKKMNGKKYKDIKFEDLAIDEEQIEIEAASMSGGDYGELTRIYYDLKRKLAAMRANGEEDSLTYKAIEAEFRGVEKGRNKLAEIIGVDRIEADKNKYIANGYRRTKTKLEFTGDIGDDFGTFKKWAKEYLSTTAGQREANLALSGTAGAAIWKLTSSMGAGKIMAPVMGVIGGSALLMSGKLKGVIDVLGENGDIMMDNGKSRRENLMTKIMQDALPAGLGAATGIKVSNFIKNHLRFGTILGPILGTVTGTAIYAIGKSGLFKGLLKGLTWLPRMLFKKIFGKEAYDSAADWINKKTGGYFGDNDTPSYREILEATSDSKSLKAAQGAAIKLLDDMKTNEMEYVKKIVRPMIEKSDKIKSAKDSNRSTERISEGMLDALELSEKALEKVYDKYKKSIKATTTINQVHDVINTAMVERDIKNKINNVEYGQSDSFKTVFGNDGKTAFKGEVKQNSEVFDEIQNRANKFNERFKDDTKPEDGEQEEGTGGAPLNTRSRNMPNPGDSNGAFSKLQKSAQTFLDEAGCAAYVAGKLMSELTGVRTDPAELYESVQPYIEGKGVHYIYFIDFAKRHKLKYRIQHLDYEPDLKWAADQLQRNSDDYHIFLISKKPGHGHFVLVWNIRNDKFMSANIYDPLNPSLKRVNVSNLLFNTKNIITIENGKNKSVEEGGGSSKTPKSNNTVDAVLDESYNNSMGLTGSSVSRKYAKGTTTGVTPIPVVIIGGHIDAIGNVGSIDMEGYKERVRMLSQDSSSSASPLLKSYSNNLFSNMGKNKYNDDQKTKQDMMETYAKENNEIFKQGFGLDGKKNQKDNKEKKGKGGLFGLIGAGLAGLLSMFGNGGGLPGMAFNGIKTIGGGILSLGKNLLFRGGKKAVEEGAEATGRSFLNNRGKVLVNGVKNIAGKAGTKLYESAFGSVTKEVVTRDVKLLGRKVGEKTVTKTTTKAGFLTNVVKKISEVIPKVVQKLEKAPLIGKFIRKHDLGKKLVDILPKVLEKGAKEVAEEGTEAVSKQVAKGGTSAVAGKTGIGAVISVGFVIYDGIQAYNDAPKYFNTPSPTLLQKVCAGIVGVALSAINAFVASDPMTVICIALLQMSDTVMGMMARFLYGMINTLVKEEPGTGAKNYTEGENAKYTTDENGNIIDNPEHKGFLGGLFEKNTSEIIGDLLTGAASKLLPAGITIGQGIIGLLGGIFNMLAGGASYALSGGDNAIKNQLENGQGMFITSTGNAYGGFNNNSSSTTDTQGKGSGEASGSGVGYGTTKSSINGLTFVSQGQFMANKSMNGESLTLNGCAISAMKMVALHLGLRIPDNKLITTARQYLDRRTNAVDINYFTSFGGLIINDPMSVKSSIANPGSAVILLVQKGQGNHFVAVINKGGNIYLGDPEEEDYRQTDLNDYWLNTFISAVVFDSSGMGNILSTAGRGRRSRLGGRASTTKTYGFKGDQSKLIKGNSAGINKFFSKANNNKKKAESLYTVQQTISNGGTAPASNGSATPPTAGGLSFPVSGIKDTGGWKWDSLPAVTGKGYNAMKPLIDSLSGKFGIPADAVTAMMYLESGLDPNNKTGSYRGLGQLNATSWNATLNESLGGIKYNGAAYGVPAIGSGGVLTDPRQNGTLFLARMAHDAKVLGKNGASNVSTGMLHMTHMLPTSMNYIGKSNPNLMDMKGMKRAYVDSNAPLTTNTGKSGGTPLSLNDSITKFNEFHVRKLKEAKGGRGSFNKFNRNFSGRGASDLFSIGTTYGKSQINKSGNALQEFSKKPQTGAEQVINKTKQQTTNTPNVSVLSSDNPIQYSGGNGQPAWLAKAIGENGNKDGKRYGRSDKWCMAFVNWCFNQTGYKVTMNDSSQAPVASDEWVKVKNAVPGVVIVLARGKDAKGKDEDGAVAGHAMFFVGKAEGQGGTWKVCTGNPEVKIKDYHLDVSGKTFVGYFIPKVALKDLKGVQEIPKTEVSDINAQSNEGGGTDGTEGNNGGVSANVIAKGKFITSSGKVFNVTKLITGAMQALGKIMSGNTSSTSTSNTGDGNTSNAGAGSLGLTASNDAVSGLKPSNVGAPKDSPAYKAAEIAVNSEYGKRTTSAHKCARGVMTHVAQGFGKSYSEVAGDANQFLGASGISGFGNDGSRAGVLKGLGYEMISVTSTPYPGDILVYNHPTKKPWYGHITLLATNGKWVSDFTQASFYVYNSSGKPATACKYTLWRYTKGNGGDDSPVTIDSGNKKQVLTGLGFKSTARVNILPRVPNIDPINTHNGDVGFNNEVKSNANKWNPVARVSKVKYSGESELPLAEFKQSLDNLAKTMKENIGVNKGILKASVDQIGILGDISKTGKKQYKLNQHMIKGITADGKNEDNFKKLQDKLNEWTSALKKDYNVAVEDY